MAHIARAGFLREGRNFDELTGAFHLKETFYTKNYEFCKSRKTKFEYILLYFKLSSAVLAS